VQSTGRNDIIATLDPGRNRIKREAALRLRRDSQEPMAHRITTSCSVIIGDTNRRFFEPAPRRNAIVGINAVSRF
jgi:hypothetical protein